VKIYVASSWRNAHQPVVVAALRDQGHDVYDFRNPSPGDQGFDWSQVDPGWRTWSLADYVGALASTRAEEGFQNDYRALEWCDCCVLVLPCGASAHLEAGWCAGRDKPVLAFVPEACEPELMYKLFDCNRSAITGTIDDLFTALTRVAARDGTRFR